MRTTTASLCGPRVHSARTNSTLQVLPSCAGFMRRLFNCSQGVAFQGLLNAAKVRCRRVGQKRALRVMDSQPLLTDQKVLQEQQEQQEQSHHSTEWSGGGEKLE
jgi:hypothetical protein